ncbi:MAG: hypothetical protein QNK03_05605 [Myxococcota bacterium]|nr:hypothetical protein [Myxococcota bacterium]
MLDLAFRPPALLLSFATCTPEAIAEGLEPVDRPPSLLGRFASFLMQRQLGKVIMPARVVYDRIPRMHDLAYGMARLQDRGFELDHATRLLAQSWLAMVNGCGFCIDGAKALAVINAIENFYNLIDVPLGIEEHGLCALAQARSPAPGPGPADRRVRNTAGPCRPRAPENRSRARRSRR